MFLMARQGFFFLLQEHENNKWQSSTHTNYNKSNEYFLGWEKEQQKGQHEQRQMF